MRVARVGGMVLASPDAALVRRETALPGLSTLLDPGALNAAIVAEGLPIETPDAAPAYLRYKPGTSCLVGYSASHGAEPTLFYATAFTPDSAKLVKATKRKRSPWRQGGGRFVLRHEAIELCFFPNDDHLPALVDLLNPENESTYRARVLAYKPERRCTLAINSGSRRVVVKAYAPAGFAAAERSARAMQNVAGVNFQRLQSVDTERRLLFFEWLDGRTLSEQILSGRAEAADSYATGATLAKLHSVQPPDLPVRNRHESNTLEAVARTVSVLSPDSAEAAMFIARRVSEFLAGDDSPVIVTHGDFYARQALLRSADAWLLDLDEAALGVAAFDIGNFIAYLELDAARGMISRDSIDMHAQSFLDGYSSQSALPSASLITVHCAASLFALAHYPFRRHLPEWERVIARIIARAAQLLDDSKAAFRMAQTESSGSDSSNSASPLDKALSRKEAETCLDGRVELNGKPARVSRVNAARLIRNKPGRRSIVEYDVTLISDVGTIEDTLVGKIRWRGLDRQGYETLVALHRGGFAEGAPDGIAVPAPRGTVEPFKMWLSSKVRGDPITKFVLSRDSGAVAERVVDAEYKLNRSRHVPRRTHTLDNELDILTGKLAVVQRRCPMIADRVTDVERGCRAIAASAVADERVPIHRDFYGDQLLIDDGRLWILDLDLVCLGDPAVDIGNFLGHVMEFALRTVGDPNAAEVFENSLIERAAQLYGRAMTQRAEVFRTLTLARHVWISTEKPERGAVTEPLLELCEARLSSASVNSSAGAGL